MKNIIFLILLLTLFSCHHYRIHGKKYTIVEKVSLHEGTFITFFKNRVFVKCIEKVYHQDSLAMQSHLFKTWMSYEAYGGMIFEYNDYKAIENSIDSLSSAFVKKYFSGWDHRSERDVLTTCLNFRNSKQLDSVAMSFYRRYKIRQKFKEDFDWPKDY